MSCDEIRPLLLGRRRGTLGAAEAARVDAHLATCRACREEDRADAALSEALEGKLPRFRAPDELHRRVAAKSRPARRRWPARTAMAMAAGAALGVAVVLGAGAWRGRGDALVAEAVNDHLRILYGTRPLEVESGGVHQVKPWFAGRVDFAPVVPFAGDDDFPLQGGAVAYVLDRKAAAFVFKRRLHVVTLFVFPAAGLPWPVAGEALGPARATVRTERGFHVVLWRQGDLGYAVASDLDPKELLDFARREVAGG